MRLRGGRDVLPDESHKRFARGDSLASNAEPFAMVRAGFYFRMMDDGSPVGATSLGFRRWAEDLTRREDKQRRASPDAATLDELAGEWEALAGERDAHTGVADDPSIRRRSAEDRAHAYVLRQEARRLAQGSDL